MADELIDFRVKTLEKGASEMRKEITQGLGEIRDEVDRGNEAHAKALREITEPIVKVTTLLGAHIDHHNGEHKALDKRVDGIEKEAKAGASNTRNGAVASGAGVGGGVFVVLAQKIIDLIQGGT